MSESQCCSGQVTIQSRAIEGTVPCPRCGASVETVSWSLLEATCNPERAASLANGSLLVATCSCCGTLIPLDYPLFYVDRDRKVAAYYPAGQGDLEAIKTAFVQAVMRLGGVDLGSLRRQEFAMRVVPARHELAEKVCAWQAGLDDELLEVFKASLLQELQARNPELGLTDLQFTGLEGGGLGEEGCKLGFVLFTSDGDETVPCGAAISLPEEAYRRLASSLEVRSQIDGHRSPVVDGAWGREVLAAAEGRA